MTNRVAKFLEGTHSGPPEDSVRSFFLACEYKPGGEFWSIIEPFAYDIQPAFVYGSLGVLGYEPETYSIVETGEEGGQPLMGYLMTITHPETIEFLDRAKYFLGEDAFNMHVRTLTTVFTDIKSSTEAWCYVQIGRAHV